MNKKQLIAIIIIIIVSLHLTTIKTKAITGEEAGVLPAVITLDNALKGEQYYKRNIRIINGNENQTTFDLLTTGDIQNWIEFYEIEDTELTKSITQVTIPGLTKQKINVVFQIPKTIANGQYRGNIYAQTQGIENPNLTGIKIKLPITIIINVIGEQILNGEILNIQTNDVEIGQPIQIEINFKNTGNVIATPEIKIDIIREGYLIDTFHYKETSVDVNTGKFIKPTWDTTNHEPGKYTAKITTYLDNKIIHQQDLNFEIYPRGTLTRQGEIIDFYYTGDLAVGNLIKFHAKFKNTGAVEIPAKFFVEIYKENALIDVKESNEEPVVTIAESYHFETYYKIQEKGEYKIIGYVSYGNNKTSNVNLSFIIEEQNNDINMTHVGIMVGIICFAFVGVIFLKRNTYYKNNKKIKK